MTSHIWGSSQANQWFKHWPIFRKQGLILIYITSCPGTEESLSEVCPTDTACVLISSPLLTDYHQKLCQPPIPIIMLSDPIFSAGQTSTLIPCFRQSNFWHEWRIKTAILSLPTLSLRKPGNSFGLKRHVLERYLRKQKYFILWDAINEARPLMLDYIFLWL